MIARIVKSALVGLLALLFLAASVLLIHRAVEQHQIAAANAIAIPPGVNSLEQVQLGGVPQWIQIRGQDATKPVLLILPGGPGLPEMPYYYVNAALEKDFVVVEWDQRGSGKSFQPNIPGNSLTLAQLVSDTRELIKLLRQRFHQPNVFLLAHSSGSVVGMMIVAQNPQLVRAYVGLSQIANLEATEIFLNDFVLRAAEKAGDSEALREMKEIGPPPYQNAKQLQVSQKWVNHFAPDRFALLSVDRWRLAWFSPAYTLLDFVRFVRGAKFSFSHLWRELFAVDLFHEIPRVEVPVYFFAGRQDRVVTGEVAEKYFQALEAPKGKQFFWFEESGHWPQLEEPVKFRSIMVDQVLKQNSR